MFFISGQPHITQYEPTKWLVLQPVHPNARWSNFPGLMALLAPDDSDEIFAGFKEFFPLPGARSAVRSAVQLRCVLKLSMGDLSVNRLWGVCVYIQYHTKR